jgi:hypothetical protein
MRPGISLSDRIGNRPHAELVAFQSGREIGDCGVEQVLFGLIEDAKMRSPRNITDDADA